MASWILIMSIEAGIIYKMYRKHVNNLKPFHLNMMILIGLMRNKTWWGWLRFTFLQEIFLCTLSGSSVDLVSTFFPTQISVFLSLSWSHGSTFRGTSASSSSKVGLYSGPQGGRNSTIMLVFLMPRIWRSCYFLFFSWFVVLKSENISIV